MVPGCSATVGERVVVPRLTSVHLIFMILDHSGRTSSNYLPQTQTYKSYHLQPRILVSGLGLG